ncbi:MAG: 2-amino-4-hydroxy-6-hydroxymethyldihydropteridine diphosphokinase [Armatimonadetes bacterium]|nr:2-amino-4-hydroxy-6-hydroxymethyldihydropteridine diphosphokinase [Armatimonadota bacterium]
MSKFPRAYLSIGSNLGNRKENLKKALLEISKEIKILKTSSFYETSPWGNINQPWFINAVIKVQTKFNPCELLDFLQNIEKKLGRIRPFYMAPRIIDLDLLIYEKENFNNKKLIIPHHGINKRLFVLIPLLEIAPRLRDLKSGKAYREIAKNLTKKSEQIINKIS